MHSASSAARVRASHESRLEDIAQLCASANDGPPRVVSLDTQTPAHFALDAKAGTKVRQAAEFVRSSVVRALGAAGQVPTPELDNSGTKLFTRVVAQGDGTHVNERHVVRLMKTVADVRFLCSLAGKRLDDAVDIAVDFRMACADDPITLEARLFELMREHPLWSVAQLLERVLASSALAKEAQRRRDLPQAWAPAAGEKDVAAAAVHDQKSSVPAAGVVLASTQATAVDRPAERAPTRKQASRGQPVEVRDAKHASPAASDIERARTYLQQRFPRVDATIVDVFAQTALHRAGTLGRTMKAEVEGVTVHALRHHLATGKGGSFMAGPLSQALLDEFKPYQAAVKESAPKLK